MKEIPNVPQVAGCPCYSDGRRPCECGITERALRAWMYGNPDMPPMTAEQREWCLAEIDSVEGFCRAQFVRATDKDLANGVLNAWLEYCRDKGLC